MKKIESNIPIKLICQNLRQLRRKLGFRKARPFAKKMGINYTTYKNYEDFRVPPPEFLFLLKQKFPQEVNIDALFCFPSKSEENQTMQENTSTYRTNITSFRAHRSLETEIAKVVKKVLHIMESDVQDIKKALIQNVNAFYKAIFWAKGQPPPSERTKKKNRI